MGDRIEQSQPEQGLGNREEMGAEQGLGNREDVTAEQGRGNREDVAPEEPGVAALMDDYEEIGVIEGYRVFVSYAREGPDREEAMALYQAAKNSVLYQNLAAMGGGGEE